MKIKKPLFKTIIKGKDTYLHSSEGEIICWATTKFLKELLSKDLTKKEK